MTTAREVMTPGCAYATTGETLANAARIMRDAGVGMLPICDSNTQLAGMLTDRDIVVRGVAADVDPQTVTVGELTDGKPLTIGVDDPVEDALITMVSHRVRRLAVVDGAQLVGMLSQADVARSLPDDRVGDLIEAISTPPRDARTRTA